MSHVAAGSKFIGQKRKCWDNISSSVGNLPFNSFTNYFSGKSPTHNYWAQPFPSTYLLVRWRRRNEGQPHSFNDDNQKKEIIDINQEIDCACLQYGFWCVWSRNRNSFEWIIGTRAPSSDDVFMVLVTKTPKLGTENYVGPTGASWNDERRNGNMNGIVYHAITHGHSTYSLNIYYFDKGLAYSVRSSPFQKSWITCNKLPSPTSLILHPSITFCSFHSSHGIRKQPIH